MKRCKVQSRVRPIVLPRAAIPYISQVIDWTSDNAFPGADYMTAWWAACQENEYSWTVSLLRGLLNLGSDTIARRLRAYEGGYIRGSGGYLVDTWLILELSGYLAMYPSLPQPSLVEASAEMIVVPVPLELLHYFVQGCRELSQIPLCDWWKKHGDKNGTVPSWIIAELSGVVRIDSKYEILDTNVIKWNGWIIQQNLVFRET